LSILPLYLFFFFMIQRPPTSTLFPSRRSSDLRTLSPEQPVERAATLEDVRAEVLAPDRLNALVFGGFAGLALLIAVVGVAGVLADRKSTRLNSSHVKISYAVFCLKKKNISIQK